MTIGPFVPPCNSFNSLIFGFTPDKRFLYAVDLGADKIVMYNYKDGVLKENTDYTVNVVPGSGPRHLIFSQDGRYGYLINEIANKIMVFKYNENNNVEFVGGQAMPPAALMKM